jgi:hypothetical protein
VHLRGGGCGLVSDLWWFDHLVADGPLDVAAI